MPGRSSKYLLIAALVIAALSAAFVFTTDLLTPPSIEHAAELMADGKTDRAESVLLRLEDSEAHGAEAMLLLGNIALGRGDIELAGEYYLLSSCEDPTASAFNNLGLVYLKQGRPEEALARFLAGIEADPDFAAAYYNAGLLLQADGEPGLALAKFSEALAVSPDHTMARYRRACLLLAMDETAMAISEFESLDETQPEFLPARADLGYALLQDGRPGEAREQFEAAIAANAEFDRAHYGLGIVRVQLMDYAGATESFRRASEIDPANAAYRADMAFCIYLKGEPGAAVACQSHLYDALKLEPHNPRAVKLAAAFYDAELAVYSEVSDE